MQGSALQTQDPEGQREDEKCFLEDEMAESPSDTNPFGSAFSSSHVKEVSEQRNTHEKYH